MRIIPQGRSFISRLLDLSKTVNNLHENINLDEGCRSDIRFWSLLCDNWNSISFFHNKEPETSVSLKLFTEAAPSVCFGGFYNNLWSADGWPKEMFSLPQNAQSTALLELFPVVVACLLWRSGLCRKKIVVFCDNEATVSIINKGRSSTPFINRFIRCLTWTSVMSNFPLHAAHLPGLNNSLADSLSRFNFQKFRLLCPNAARQGLICPPSHRLHSIRRHPPRLHEISNSLHEEWTW